MSLMGDGIGHLAFAGVAAGLLLEVWPIWTALVVAVGRRASLIEWLRTRGSASGDLALALVLLRRHRARRRAREPRSATSSVNVLPYLFGSILTVDAGRRAASSSRSAP